jgi:hypothetical protein
MQQSECEIINHAMRKGIARLEGWVDGGENRTVAVSRSTVLYHGDRRLHSRLVFLVAPQILWYALGSVRYGRLGKDGRSTKSVAAE